MLNDIYQTLNPVAFSLGPVDVRWYGIAYMLGFLAAAILMVRITKHWRIRFDIDSVLVIMICVMVGVIVGGRLGYCIAYGNGFYFQHPLEILSLNKGGMSFHGGLCGALLSGIVAARFTGIPYLTLADIGCIVAPIGLFFGRIANFINGELWGAVTDAPWGVVFGGAAGLLPRHPSQLYEAALEGIVLFVVLFILSRKHTPRPRGTFLGLFLMLYGVFRVLIEFVRQPDVQIGYLAGDWLTMGMVLSFPLIIIGACVFAYARVKQLPQQGVPEVAGDGDDGNRSVDETARGARG